MFRSITAWLRSHLLTIIIGFGLVALAVIAFIERATVVPFAIRVYRFAEILLGPHVTRALEWALNNPLYSLGSILALILFLIGWRLRGRSSRVPPTGGPIAPKKTIGLLTLESEWNILILSLIDLAISYLVVILLGAVSQTYLPPLIQYLPAIVLAFLALLWQTDMFRNHVDTFEAGAVTFLDRPIPSGKDGKGLGPGYWGFPLGKPFFKLDFKESTKEFPITFDRMDVWLLNDKVEFRPSAERRKWTDVSDAKGGVKGVLAGLAQFKIVDLVAWNAAGVPMQVLNDLALESARDAAENMMAEGFVAKDNDELGNMIYKIIQGKLATRRSPLGVDCISLTISLTDMTDPTVTLAWADITASRARAISRANDNVAQVGRVQKLRDEGSINAELAAAVDLAATGAKGVTVENKRGTFDVGAAIDNLAKTVVEAIKKKMEEK